MTDMIVQVQNFYFSNKSIEDIIIYWTFILLWTIILRILKNISLVIMYAQFAVSLNIDF